MSSKWPFWVTCYSLTPHYLSRIYNCTIFSSPNRFSVQHVNRTNSLRRSTDTKLSKHIHVQGQLGGLLLHYHRPTSFWSEYICSLYYDVKNCPRPINPLTAEWALRALIDFTLSNARRFYSSMGNLLDGKGLKTMNFKRVVWFIKKW